MIEVRNLSKVFPGGARALSEVTVTIPQGDFVAIIGLSGAGKTTFLRTLNRLVEPTSGEIWVDGVEVTRLSRRELQAFRRRVGFIFQQFNLVQRLTVLDNVLHGRLGYLPPWKGLLGLYREEDTAIALEQIRRVGLQGKERARADQLSGGQQQRVAIARALAQEPELILADEPMASLDPRLSDVILGILREYNQEEGVTVLVNIHVLELARRYAKRVLAFNRGRLVFDGPAEALTPEVERMVYAGNLEAL